MSPPEEKMQERPEEVARRGIGRGAAGTAGAPIEILGKVIRALWAVRNELAAVGPKRILRDNRRLAASPARK